MSQPEVLTQFDRVMRLRTMSECFEDAQKARISIGLRIGSKTVSATVVEEALHTMQASERMIALEMKRSFRKAYPEIYLWVKETMGLGEHAFARLLGVIGDPINATPHHYEGETLVADEPYKRSVSQLWSYCGHGDATRKRKKGMSKEDAAAMGSPRAKMLVHLIAESTMKVMASPYRPYYDKYKDEYATAHPEWNPGHCHNAALRRVGKDILKDMYVVAEAAAV